MVYVERYIIRFRANSHTHLLAYMIQYEYKHSSKCLSAYKFQALPPCIVSLPRTCPRTNRLISTQAYALVRLTSKHLKISTIIISDLRVDYPQGYIIYITRKWPTTTNNERFFFFFIYVDPCTHMVCQFCKHCFFFAITLNLLKYCQCSS